MSTTATEQAAAVLLPIEVYGFPLLTPTTPSPSGYCQKLECYLRFASIYHTNRDGTPFSAPKGKLPYAKIGDVTVPDSHFIIRHLISEGYTDLDKKAGLTEKEKGEGRSWRMYWEEMVYPATVRMRWFEPANYNVVTEEAFGQLPFPIRPVIRYFINSRVKTNLAAAGIGRHTTAEVLSILSTAYDDLANKIGDGPWVMGSKGPAEIDAVISGFLLNALGTGSNPEVVEMIKKRKELVGYVLRVMGRWWPEYKEVVLERLAQNGA